MSGFAWFEEQVYGHFETWWPAAGKVTVREGQLEDPPPALLPNSGHTPGAGEPYAELHIVYGQRVQFGAPPDTTFEGAGFFQLDVYVDSGSGTALAAELADRQQAMWDAHAVSGLHTYTAQGPFELKAPEGWYARHTDMRWNWFWEP